MSRGQRAGPRLARPATITHETIQAAFRNNTPPDLATAGHKRLRPELLAPFVTPVSTTAEIFETLPRYHVSTLHDHAVTHVYTLEADHSSRCSQKDRLATALVAIRDSAG